MITEDQARMIGKAIRTEAGLVATPLQNAIERRAFCLKMAIDTRGSAFGTDSKPTEDAADVLVAARMYDDFISGSAARATSLDEWDVSPADLATMLNIPVRTIWGWNAAGTGPRFTRVGKHVRYSRQSVHEWIDGGEAVAHVA